MSRRRALLASTQSQNGGIDFPVYIDFTILNNDKRIHYPTPQTVAFFDYIMQNAVWDGRQYFDIYFQPNMVYIDGVEIHYMSFETFNAEWERVYNMGWYPRPDWLNWMWVVNPYFFDTGTYPKGTIYCYNDD